MKKVIPRPAGCVCGTGDCGVAFGYCHCGCGQKTNIAPNTVPSKMQYRGSPLRFLPLHGRRSGKFWIRRERTPKPLISQETLPFFPEKDLAFACGLFEGEGTVSMMRPTLRNWGSLYASVANTDKSLLDFFLSRWGGTIHAIKRTCRRKQAWRWVISSRQAARFIRAIQPYAVSPRMKERIFLGITYQDHKIGMSRWMPEEERNDYWKLNVWFFLQFKHLNQRGCPESDSFRKK